MDILNLLLLIANLAVLMAVAIELRRLRFLIIRPGVSLSMALCLFISITSWLVYGILSHSVVITLINSIGVVLSLSIVERLLHKFLKDKNESRKNFKKRI